MKLEKRLRQEVLLTRELRRQQKLLRDEWRKLLEIKPEPIIYVPEPEPVEEEAP